MGTDEFAKSEEAGFRKGKFGVEIFALNGFENLKVDDGVADEVISSDVAKIKGKSKSVMQNWGKGISLLKSGEVGHWWNQIMVWATAKDDTLRGSGFGLDNARIYLAKHSSRSFAANGICRIVQCKDSDMAVVDLEEHSTIVFKENANPTDGKALGDDGADGIGKGVSKSKARGLVNAQLDMEISIGLEALEGKKKLEPESSKQ
ncbi:hypothetical protein Godav_023430 [Gossypium davidsonii]|uniref:Uncharacterized protein n=1 Tax=Gossypium davidsonii TaxID=34287 RepID=A0A7J8SSI6_GOSDV|nr:hypothetical protein [Gossypium davidsonii]